MATRKSSKAKKSKKPLSYELNTGYRSLGQMLTDLKRITAGCRDDMHEPDEQDVTARIGGTKFDNAGFDTEMHIRIYNREGYHQTFNIATLVALARFAVIKL